MWAPSSVVSQDSAFNSWEKEGREAMKQYIGKKKCLREIISSFTDQHIVCCQADPSFTSCEVCEKNIEKNDTADSLSSIFALTSMPISAPKEARVREIFKKDKFVCL